MYLIIIKTSNPAHTSRIDCGEYPSHLILIRCIALYRRRWTISGRRSRRDNHRVGNLSVELITLDCSKTKVKSKTLGAFKTDVMDQTNRESSLSWRLLHLCRRHCRGQIGGAPATSSVTHISVQFHHGIWLHLIKANKLAPWWLSYRSRSCQNRLQQAHHNRDDKSEHPERKLKSTRR